MEAERKEAMQMSGFATAMDEGDNGLGSALILGYHLWLAVREGELSGDLFVRKCVYKYANLHGAKGSHCLISSIVK